MPDAKCHRVLRHRTVSAEDDATYRTASEKLDQWAVEQAILADQQFIPWFTSYWTEQVLTAKQLMYRLDEVFGKPVSLRSKKLSADERRFSQMNLFICCNLRESAVQAKNEPQYSF